LKNVVDRETERDPADRRLAAPGLILPGQIGRKVYMCRCFEAHLRQEIPLCLILEETIEEAVMVTLYNTSQSERYMRGGMP
jgi:hypothetical protein